MSVYFKLKDFIIEDSDQISVEVADKIYKYHINPIIPIREKMKLPIWASQNSSYRPEEYEKKKGRSGKSQHCFVLKGATDWTCSNFRTNKDILLEEMIQQTDYTRFAVYYGFIHADYKETKSGKRELFESGPDSKWIFQKFI